MSFDASPALLAEADALVDPVSTVADARSYQLGRDRDMSQPLITQAMVLALLGRCQYKCRRFVQYELLNRALYRDLDEPRFVRDDVVALVAEWLELVRSSREY